MAESTFAVGDLQGQIKALNSKIAKKDTLSVSVRSTFSDKISIQNNNSIVYQDSLIILAIHFEATAQIAQGEINVFETDHRAIRGISGVIVSINDSSYAGTFYMSSTNIFLNFTNGSAASRKYVLQGIGEYYS